MKRHLLEILIDHKSGKYVWWMQLKIIKLTSLFYNTNMEPKMKEKTLSLMKIDLPWSQILYTFKNTFD